MVIDPKRSITRDYCEWCNFTPDEPREQWSVPDHDNRWISFGSLECYHRWVALYWSWKHSGYVATGPENLRHLPGSPTCADVPGTFHGLWAPYLP